MVSEFVTKLALSFIVGGVWIALTTLLAEKSGTKAGGVLGGLPSTIVVSLFFIGWTNGAVFAVESTNVMPAVLMVDMIFLLVCMALLERGLSIAIGGAFAVWFLLSLPFVLLEIDFSSSLIVLLFGTIFSLYALKEMGIESKERSSVSYRPFELLARAAFAGSVIALAVLVSRVGGPFWGGMFAVFPAVFTSSIVILSIRQGGEFAKAVGKMLMVSTSVNITVFIAVCRYTYVAFGIVEGTTIGYLFSLLSATGVFGIAKKFMK